MLELYALLAAGEDGDNSGVGFLEIFQSFLTREAFLFGTKPSEE